MKRIKSDSGQTNYNQSSYGNNVMKVNGEGKFFNEIEPRKNRKPRGWDRSASPDPRLISESNNRKYDEFWKNVISQQSVKTVKTYPFNYEEFRTSLSTVSEIKFNFEKSNDLMSKSYEESELRFVRSNNIPGWKPPVPPKPKSIRYNSNYVTHYGTLREDCSRRRGFRMEEDGDGIKKGIGKREKDVEYADEDVKRDSLADLDKFIQEMKDFSRSLEHSNRPGRFLKSKKDSFGGIGTISLVRWRFFFSFIYFRDVICLGSCV